MHPLLLADLSCLIQWLLVDPATVSILALVAARARGYTQHGAYRLLFEPLLQLLEPLVHSQVHHAPLSSLPVACQTRPRALTDWHTRPRSKLYWLLVGPCARRVPHPPCGLAARAAPGLGAPARLLGLRPATQGRPSVRVGRRCSAGVCVCARAVAPRPPQRATAPRYRSRAIVARAVCALRERRWALAGLTVHQSIPQSIDRADRRYSQLYSTGTALACVHCTVPYHSRTVSSEYSVRATERGDSTGWSLGEFSEREPGREFSSHQSCSPVNDFGPQSFPIPVIHFISSLGFALQRANSRMLRIADRRRRKARSCGLYSSGTRPSPLSLGDGY